jgi:7-carboxy-7-deazaguanine synthase
VKTGLLPPELAALRPHELFVNEFFYSIQGESTHAGRPCFFIRLAGCRLRCTWCDSTYSFHEGRICSIEGCIARVRQSPARLVEVTGGEPLLQPAVFPLMEQLCDLGFELLLETSGSVGIERVDPRVKRIVDWKCPGSGMEGNNDPAVLRSLKAGDELKFVLLDRSDYDWSRAWLEEHAAGLPAHLPVHFSPVFGRVRFEDLARWILEDGLEVRLNLQVHKWIWTPGTRGV